MKFSAVAPIPRLASIVRCVWTLEADAAEMAGSLEPVLPDGCPELVMHFGDAFERIHPDAPSERQSSLLFAGQLTGQIELRATGAVAVLGIRFHPAGAASILRMPQRQLLGATANLADIDQGLFRSLREISESCRSLTEAAARVQRYLATRIDGRWFDARVQSAVAHIQRSRGQVNIDALARHVNLTRRHLEREFDVHVGVSPKRLARIVRFQRALRLVLDPTAAGHGADTAMECGYADQSHFIREFAELAGCSPTAHLIRHAELSGLFAGSALSPEP
jgi:AraC-like DNA-binding protein